MSFSFSLIIATLNRRNELKLLFQSLCAQKYKNFEVIVVDQNREELIESLIESFNSKLDIKHLKISEKGLSNARNCGLQHAKNDIISFPDDDCIYPDNLLNNVARLFTQKLYDVINVGIEDIGYRDECSEFEMYPVNYLNFDTKTSSATIFLTQAAYRAIGHFDINLGLGSRLYSAEDDDFIIRALQKKQRIFYTRRLFIWHPPVHKIIEYNMQARTRVSQYGKGSGYLIKKHLFVMRDILIFPYFLKIFLRPIMGFFLAVTTLNRAKALHYFASFRGRFTGLFL